MALYVKLYRDSENPFGFPDDYPSEAMESEKDPGSPWIQMTNQEYEALVIKSREIARSLINQSKEAEKVESGAKVASLEDTFNQLELIEEKIEASGGKLEAADQTALLLYTLEALIQLREPLIQMQKRSL